MLEIETEVKKGKSVFFLSLSFTAFVSIYLCRQTLRYSIDHLKPRLKIPDEGGVRMECNISRRDFCTER